MITVKAVGDDKVAFMMTKEEAQAVRTVLAPCGCVASKSNATAKRREKLSQALGRASFLKPGETVEME